MAEETFTNRGRLEAAACCTLTCLFDLVISAVCIPGHMRHGFTALSLEPLKSKVVDFRTLSDNLVLVGARVPRKLWSRIVGVFTHAVGVVSSAPPH